MIFWPNLFVCSSSVVERPTLDLVDPVQMGSQGSNFFYFFWLKYDTFRPLVAKSYIMNALNHTLIPKWA